MKCKFVIFGFVLCIAGCVGLMHSDFFDDLSQSSPKHRVVAAIHDGEIDYWQDVKPILNTRCVVCHGCYDAPCQLKLTAIEGVERGASKKNVYNAKRLIPAEPTRLFQDEQTIKGWREREFFPVLNEFDQTLLLNAKASLFYQTLDLKKKHPLPITQGNLSNDFSFGLGRENVCPSIEEFKHFAEKNPLWGMPYALPALTPRESETLSSWVLQGARYTPRADLPKTINKQVAKWEAFLNQPSYKNQLMARYLYEHLFLANLYFSDATSQQFFKLIRSSTAPGSPVKIIATRRPYDDPVQKFYYRLVPEYETVVAKSHLPYALNATRMSHWKKWFLEAQYTVEKLPGYNAKNKGNPFEVFKAIPVDSRYRFLLDEAQFTIMNFIKGPVCRGQVAVNVIRDHFWVFFINPDIEAVANYDAFLAENYDDLDMPNTKSNIFTPMTTWGAYADKQIDYLKKRGEFLADLKAAPIENDVDLIWNGDEVNPNAALTIFRHFDSATVEQGLLGGHPKTAWVIGYPLLERIFYLLAANYDVYGNIGHQFISRVYMDFLRMEGESNFLYFLSPEQRKKERLDWYQGAESRAIKYMELPSAEESKSSITTYNKKETKKELFDRFQLHTRQALAAGTLAVNVNLKPLVRLSKLRGAAISLLPEVSILEIIDGNNYLYFSLIKNNGHKNVSTMFDEEENILPKEHTVSVLKGVVGSYPNAFYSIKKNDLTQFVNHVERLSAEPDYYKLKSDFGVRRTDISFWAYSDRLHNFFSKSQPISWGMLDYNRLENR